MPIPRSDHSAGQGEPEALFVGRQRLKRAMSVGHVIADDENPADSVCRGLIVDRAKAIGPPNIFALAVPRHGNELIFMPGRSLTSHDRFNLWADNVPDLLPAFLPALAECAWMALRPHGLAIGVVIELDEVRPPPDEHRMLRRQKNPDCRAEALRPAVGRTDRACAPVMGPHQSAHFPAVAKKISLYDIRASSNRFDGGSI